MKLLKRKKMIFFLIIIFLSFTFYTYQLSYKNFELLDIEKIEDENISKFLKSIEKCQEFNEDLVYSCLFNTMSYFGSINFDCDRIKQEKLKKGCYYGYGRYIGKNLELDIKKIKTLCSKINIGYEMCLIGASLEIGKKSWDKKNQKNCELFSLDKAKRRCYEGIGRQLVKEGYPSSMCKEFQLKESCLLGYVYNKLILFHTKEENEKNTFKICSNFTQDLELKRCSSFVGFIYVWVQEKNKKNSFIECEKLPFPKDCKKGVVRGLILRYLNYSLSKN